MIIIIWFVHHLNWPGDIICLSTTQHDIYTTMNIFLISFVLALHNTTIYTTMNIFLISFVLALQNNTIYTTTNLFLISFLLAL